VQNFLLCQHKIFFIVPPKNLIFMLCAAACYDIICNKSANKFTIKSTNKSSTNKLTNKGVQQNIFAVPIEKMGKKYFCEIFVSATCWCYLLVLLVGATCLASVKINFCIMCSSLF
jgi:hypothetical protein